MTFTLAEIKFTVHSQDSLRLIIKDEVAKCVAVAWKVYRPLFKEPPAKPNELIHDTIKRLWEAVAPIDMNRLARIAGVPVTRAEKAFHRLRESNLIWPDGTYPEEVRAIVIGDVGGYAGGMARQASALKTNQKGKTDDGKRTPEKDATTHRKPATAKARR